MAARSGSGTPLGRILRQWGLVAVLVVCLGGCATLTAGSSGLSVRTLPPLQLDGRSLSIDAVAARAPTPDLLATDAEMRAFVQRYTEGIADPRQRLLALHRAIRGQATLGISYDPMAEGTAREVFHRTTANCLSYASLVVALAREAGLEAHYQWLKVRPEWTLQGERVVVRMHVNTAVAAGRGDHFMVDIDPVPTANITGTSRLRDTDAAALFHSNVAMQALAELQIEDAWVHSVRALQLSPGMPNLWVNLGAIYRYAGQHDVAERNYLHALQLDPTNDSAMNNLVVLYRMDGRLEELAYWDARVARYRDANPYYHAWRGDQAARDEDWQGARDHYQRALQLAPDDARLLYALGLAHLGLNEPAIATGYLQSAIAHAVLRSDIDLYAARLRELEQASALSASDAAAES